VKWSRSQDRFGYTVYVCGPYRIERFEGLAGARYVWVLTGPTGEHKRTTLRAARWEAEKHARKPQPPTS
jgi:hypothetical protein